VVSTGVVDPLQEEVSSVQAQKGNVAAARSHATSGEGSKPSQTFFSGPCLAAHLRSYEGLHALSVLQQLWNGSPALADRPTPGLHCSWSQTVQTRSSCLMTVTPQCVAHPMTLHCPSSPAHSALQLSVQQHRPAMLTGCAFHAGLTGMRPPRLSSLTHRCDGVAQHVYFNECNLG
jgi:hypothetical protein